ncbi:MAG TPA: FAD-binding oxidoreductase, partial [Fibrobacteraceae bacterium]|nr:FAD-binding oxidoreductase [Fibrobacteraceae bacterium]
VPELKTITVGGAVSGIGIEATSFRYGLVHETVEEIEVLCGDGEVRLCRADNENADLFRAIPNSYGTFGYILRLRYKVVPVCRSVRATYRRFSQRADFLSAIAQASSPQESPRPDFVEGVCFGPESFVLVTAFHGDEAPDATNAGLIPYYKGLQHKDQATLAVRDWIWRWDPDWFWCSRFYGMENPLLRCLLGRWMLRSSRYWKILNWYRRNNVEAKVHKVKRFLGRPIELFEPMIQDVEIPMDHCAEFLDFYESHIQIRPLWICPIRPLKSGDQWTLYSMKPGELHLNFGFWESVPTSAEKKPGHFNRLLEQEVTRLGGRKSLYSTSFFPEDEFWQVYNGDAYRAIKQRFDPQNRFPDLYHKVVLRK